MPSTSLLINQLEEAFPEFVFENGDDFQWQPSKKTIVYSLAHDQSDARLLHEVSHGILQHSSYLKDIDLIALEREAWSHARLKLAPAYDVQIDSETIQDDMDTYRDWLHARSTCPKCNANGLQVKKHLYRCLSCDNTWQVNEARVCALRRSNNTK